MVRCTSVLVVEDNDEIRECIQEALQMEGYPVHLASDGKEALEVLEKLAEPTLILLDLMMPVMNGWEFLDEQKKRASLAKHHIVTISAVRATKSLEDAEKLGTHGAIMKPLSLESIWREVRKHCVNPALLKQA